MLSHQEIEQTLLHLGFTKTPATRKLTYGPICIDLLDGPRLLAHSPQGLLYVAVVSKQHLTQQVASLPGFPAEAAAGNYAS